MIISNRTGAIGVKIGMTSAWNNWGVFLPLTVIQVLSSSIHFHPYLIISTIYMLLFYIHLLIIYIYLYLIYHPFCDQQTASPMPSSSSEDAREGGLYISAVGSRRNQTEEY